MSLELLVENPNDLCLSCHPEAIQEESSTYHNVEDYNCTECHLISKPADFTNGESGSTGHSFYPGVPDLTCLGCHDYDMETHTIMGTDDENCLICHDEIYMSRLHLLNGTDVPIDDATLICAQCHENIYYEWQTGLHSNAFETGETCTDCHSPMRPYIVIDATLPPVTETGSEIERPQPIVSPTIVLVVAVLAAGVIIYQFGLKGGI
jgi:hypothetical protein